jgi:hypothetical protein
VLLTLISKIILEQRFHLDGNFGLWKEIGRKYCHQEGNEKEILFYLIITKNKAIFIQFCAKEDSENAIYNDLETPYFQKRELTPPKARSHAPKSEISRMFFFSKLATMYLGQGPQNPYIEITTKRRTQGIIS